MTSQEREAALVRMQKTVSAFYFDAVKIGVHPFIEFAGVMNEYVKLCERAHAQGIDFSECNTHADFDLPMQPHNIHYINEKLECIFTGRSVINTKP